MHIVSTGTRSLLVVLLFALAACSSGVPKEGQAGMGTGPAGYGGYASGTVTPGSLQDFAANVGDRVFFEVDSALLSPTAQQTLSRQAEWLRRYPDYRLTIEGHSDERGTRAYNIALGARRATATHDFLVAQGVSPGRLRTLSYGKERPVATCQASSCWSQNRRAVLILQ